MIEHQNKLIVMLPGPPSECLPMFEEVTMPALKKAGFSQIEYHKNWFLFGVSEGEIAEKLDALAKPYDCITGYRLFYPYIEFKIHSNNKEDFEKLVPHIETLIQPYIFHDGQKTASEILRTSLAKTNITLKICDQATGGSLESIIKTPETCSHLEFTSEDKKPDILITGLEDFWNGSHATHTNISILLSDNKQASLTKKIPLRGVRVKQYAVEFICWKLCEYIDLRH
jgi:nicotinamide-nucleotide amidase